MAYLIRWNHCVGVIINDSPCPTSLSASGGRWRDIADYILWYGGWEELETNLIVVRAEELAGIRSWLLLAYMCRSARPVLNICTV